jgi:hypothetical protein
MAVTPHYGGYAKKRLTGRTAKKNAFVPGPTWQKGGAQPESKSQVHFAFFETSYCPNDFKDF